MTTAPEAASTQAPDPEDRRHKRLLSYSTQNMIYSLLAVFALAFMVWALMPSEDAIQRREVEVDSVAAYAAEQAGHPVWVPEGLPEGWTVTHVRLITVAGTQTWRLGAVSPEEEFVAISQADAPPAAWRDALLRDLEQEGTAGVRTPAGPQEAGWWTDGEDGALVLEPSDAQPATTVVHGTADRAELTQFVEHLVPRS